ncbi:TIR domain-containing protein [bacterium SCSIO 12696]|nr:TIR domain-containing protein [bacterium SCSIO 12696]
MSNSTVAHNYLYRAFISYRHTDADRKWAKWLMHSLETYRTPKTLIKKGIAQRVGRLFRDDDEIPASSDLGSQLEEALRNSEFLLVICSPNTPSSHWVRREITLFQEMGRGDRIIPLLVEGEPEDSFPSELLQTVRTRTLADGTEERYTEKMEPLAADVRPRSDEKHKATRHRALIRILAVLLKCHFDDLEQREQVRQRQRSRRLFGLFFIVAFAAMTVYAGQLFQQTRELNKERSIFLAQLAKMQSDAVDSQADDDRGQYDRAIRYAMMATLPGPLHPKSDEARDQLSRALHSQPIMLQINKPGQPFSTVAISPGKTQLTGVTTNNEITVFDFDRHRLISQFALDVGNIVSITYHPTKNWLALVTGDAVTRIIDLNIQKEIWKAPSLGVNVIKASFSYNGKYLLVSGGNRYQVWEITSGKLIDHEKFADNRLKKIDWVPWKNIIYLHLEQGKSSDYVLKTRNPITQSDINSIGSSKESIEIATTNKSGTKFYIQRRIGERPSKEHYLSIINSESFREIKKIQVKPEHLTNLLLSDDETILVASLYGGMDGAKSANIYDLNKGVIKASFEAPSPFLEIIFGAHDRQILTSHSSGVVRAWDISLTPVNNADFKLQGHDGSAVTQTYFLKKNHSVLTYGSNGSANLWSVKNIDNRITSLPFKGTPKGISFSEDGNKFFVYSEHNASVFDLSKTQNAVDNARPVFALDKWRHPKTIHAHWLPKGSGVIAYLENGEIIKSINGNFSSPEFSVLNSKILSVKENHQKSFALASLEEGIYVINVEKPEKPEKFSGPVGHVSHIAFNPSGNLAAIGTKEGGIFVWRTDNKELIYESHNKKKNPVLSLSFSPDGSYLGTSSKFGKFQVLDTTSFSEIDTKAANKEYLNVNSHKFSPHKPEVYLSGFNVKRYYSTGVLNLNTKEYRFEWSSGSWVSPDSVEFSNSTDRIFGVYENSLTKTHLNLISTDSKVITASVNKFGAGVKGGYAVNTTRGLAVTSNWNRIHLWDIFFANEANIENIRRNACNGSLSEQSLIISQEDIHQAPILKRYLGKNVCDIQPFWERNSRINPFQLRHSSITPNDFLQSIDSISTPNISSLDYLKEFLIYFDFEDLKKSSEAFPIKSNLLIAAGFMAGLGVDKDLQKSIKYYENAASLGSSAAQYNLALLLIKDNPEKSKKLIEEAAQQGLWIANRFIAQQAIKAGDTEKAKQYLKVAIDSGDSASAYLMFTINKNLSGSEKQTTAETCAIEKQAATSNSPQVALALAQCLIKIEQRDRELTKEIQKALLYAAQQDRFPKIRNAALKKLAFLKR